MTPDSDAHRALALFALKSSPNGRFLHYCWSRSRNRAFLVRQSLSLLSCLTLFLFQDALLGALGLAVLLGGDLVDTLWMRRVWTRWRRGIVPRHVRLIAFGTAVFQSATVGLIAIVAWANTATGEPTHDMQLEFFGVAYLVGVGLNAGLVRPYVPMIADAKLATLLGAFAGVLGTILWSVPNVPDWLFANAYLLAAVLILFLVANSFLRMVYTSYGRNQTAREALLRNHVALTQANSEAALREQQARRLALIAESTNEAIFVTDAEGRISWTNAAFTQITGYEFADVFGRKPSAFMNAPETDPEAVNVIYESQRSGQKARVELLNRHKDGSDHWISTNITPVFDGDGRLMMCIQVERDVTEEKQRNRELAEAKDQVEAAARAKELFFATMSHEIRTPMNGVLGMAELLSRTDLSVEQRDYLTVITQSGDALLGIINDILDLSKLQSGMVQVERAAFDLTALVQGVVNLLRPLAADKGIALSVVAGGLFSPVWVCGDCGRIRQILMNLVGNAIKFTTVGEVSVSMLSADNNFWVVQVKDTGIGIAPDRLQSVFESFTQADSAINRKYGGTGLGLTISRMLARTMGGDVQATSQQGQGSVFVLTLPLPATEMVPAPTQPEVAVLQIVRPAAEKRILIAEDNGTNRLILRKMLEAEGIVLTEVENGADAVARYCEQAPDLVVMDMQMPVMDGLTAIRAIRLAEQQTGRQRCPILVLTANVFPEDVQASFDADCDDFLTKPVLRAALLARTSRLLGQGFAEQPLPGRRLLA